MWMSVCLIMGAVSTHVRTQLAPITASVSLETGLLKTDTPVFVSTPWGALDISYCMWCALGWLYTQLFRIFDPDWSITTLCGHSCND